MVICFITLALIGKINVFRNILLLFRTVAPEQRASLKNPWPSISLAAGRALLAFPAD